MGCTENGHNHYRGKVMEPSCSTQKVQYGKYRKRHRYKEKRTAEQSDITIAYEIADPYNVIQYKKADGKTEPYIPKFNRLTANQKCDRKQIGDAADLLDDLNPMRDRCALFRLSLRRKNGISNVDQHGQSKHHKSNPRKG